jgi:urea transport system permease protein
MTRGIQPVLAACSGPRGWRSPRVLVVVVLVRCAHLLLPADHPLRPSSYWVTLIGKFMCYAIVALAMD